MRDISEFPKDASGRFLIYGTAQTQWCGEGPDEEWGEEADFYVGELYSLPTHPNVFVVYDGAGEDWIFVYATLWDFLPKPERGDISLNRIEVTEEMLEAGVYELTSVGDEWGDAELKLAFMAMLQAKRSSAV